LQPEVIMVESIRTVFEATRTVPTRWICAAATTTAFGWLLAHDAIHPLLVYGLQLYLSF
jgi:hypothetical protein